MGSFIVNKASEFLFQSLRQFGLKKFIQVYKLYRQENIKWFRVIYLNPFKVVKYIFNVLYKYLKNTKYNNIN